jgi:hypothetical protein
VGNKHKKNERKLKNNTNEFHDLETCYQQLLDHFRGNRVENIQEFAEGKITDRDLFLHILDQAVNLILDIQHREKFEGYLKKYRRYLKRAMPDAEAESYEKPLKTFSHLLTTVRKLEKEYHPNRRSYTDEMSAI